MIPTATFHTSRGDLDLLETYMAIDSVATGRIPSLLCVVVKQGFTDLERVLFRTLITKETNDF